MSPAAGTADSGTAVLTLAHGRHDHLLAQVEGLARSTHPPDLHVVVAMDDPDLGGGLVPVGHEGWQTVVVPLFAPDGGLPLAAARNLAARTAVGRGAAALIFLDVDCIPGAELVATYRDVVGVGTPGWTGPMVWCGDVAYLDAAPEQGYDVTRLEPLATRKPGRPRLAPGQTRAEPVLERFWSLSFAMSAGDYAATGGFCEDYVGYGGEDTDFAQLLRAAGGGMRWVGGATAYHQHHESHSPPVGKVADVVRNAGLFHDRWGWWPMRGWLEEFDRRGLAHQDAGTGRWVVTP